MELLIICKFVQEKIFKYYTRVSQDFEYIMSCILLVGRGPAESWLLFIFAEPWSKKKDSLNKRESPLYLVLIILQQIGLLG